MTDYTVRDEPDYAVTYDEDEMITVRKGDLRAVLDVVTGGMDFGSGFLDNEQVEALRKAATILGIDLAKVTPSNFVCLYSGEHTAMRWQPRMGSHRGHYVPHWYCGACGESDYERPEPSE